MQRFAESRIARLLVLVGALACLAYAYFARKPSTLDRAVYDWTVREIMPPAAARTDVVWIDVDDQSLHDLGEHWPLQRSTWARTFEALGQLKPAAVAVDAWFPEPASREASDLADEFSARLRSEPQLAQLPAAQTVATDLATQAVLRDGDRQMIDALGRARVVVLGITEAEHTPDTLARPEYEALPQVPGVDHPGELRAHLQEPRLSLAPIALAARSHGCLHVPFDVDGVVRRYPLVARALNRPVPSLALATVQVAFGDKAAQFGQLAAALDGGIPLLRYPKVGEFPRLRLSDLLAAAPDSAALQRGIAGKIAVIGVSALGASDRRSTPLRTDMPGTLLHLAAIANLLNGEFLQTRNEPARLALLVAALLALLTFAAATRRQSFAWVVGTGVAALLAWGGAVYGGLAMGVWLPVVPVWIALAWIVVAELALRGASNEASKRRIREAFAHYLAPAVVEQLVREPDRLKLGGERRTITAFFSDIKNFTTIAEQLEPDALVGLLNECLGAMTDIILEEGGTIDKYIGDAIVAMFGAPFDQPDHAVRACRAALRCQAKLRQLRQKWQSQGMPALEARIGINSGTALVGNIGSARRFDYSMMGDTVNLAARLEGANTLYETGILVGENTAQLASSEVMLREIDWVRVKGRSQGVRIFEPLAMQQGAPENLQQRLVGYMVAMRHLRAKEFAMASGLFGQLAEQGDLPAGVMLARSQAFEREPPAGDWDGSWQLTNK